MTDLARAEAEVRILAWATETVLGVMRATRVPSPSPMPDLSGYYPVTARGHVHAFERVVFQTAYGAERLEEHCPCGAVRSAA